MVHAASPAGSVTARRPDPSPAHSPSTWLERAIAATERRWRWALAALMLLDALLLLYMGRGLTFFYDEWEFIARDYGGGIHVLLTAHGGNISIFPVASYKILFHLVGLHHYAVYRLVVVVLHLLSAGLVFVLAARRIPRVPALLATALVLFLGAAWEDLLWAFQVGYMLSIAGGLATWVLLERDDRRGDVAAMLCLTVAAGSSSLGIALMVGVAVELAWRRQWRRGFLVAVPAALYVLWYLTHGESQVTRESLINTPGYVADLMAAAVGGLVGRGLDWGRPLALVGLLVLVRRLARPLPVSARLAGLLATGLALWTVTALARSTISPPESSRYIYLGAVVIVLVGVELLRGVALGPRAVGLAAALTAYAALTGLTLMHAGATGLRKTSQIVTAELGALELAAAHAPPGYQPDPVKAPPVMAGSYLHTVRAIGSSPADTPAEIAAADSTSRAAADGVLVALEAPTATPLATATPSPGAPTPSVIAASGANVTGHGPCLEIAPSPASTVQVAVPAGGVAIFNHGRAPAALALRRFGDPYIPLAAPVAPGHASALHPAADASPVPWRLQLSGAGGVSVCGLAG